jgi:hypothetical protein
VKSPKSGWQQVDGFDSVPHCPGTPAKALHCLTIRRRGAESSHDQTHFFSAVSGIIEFQIDDGMRARETSPVFPGEKA